MRTPTIERITELLKGRSYTERAAGEYWLVKTKYERLHRMIIKREAGTLDFEPDCPMEQWKAQAATMGGYLYQLEIKAEYEDMDFDDLLTIPPCPAEDDAAEQAIPCAPGERFTWKGRTYVALGMEQGGMLAITEKPVFEEEPFDEDGSND